MIFGLAEWLLQHERAEVNHILIQTSNHALLFLDSNSGQNKTKARFIFETRWTNRQDCEELVKQLSLESTNKKI